MKLKFIQIELGKVIGVDTNKKEAIQMNNLLSKILLMMLNINIRIGCIFFNKLTARWYLIAH